MMSFGIFHGGSFEFISGRGRRLIFCCLHSLDEFIMAEGTLIFRELFLVIDFAIFVRGELVENVRFLIKLACRKSLRSKTVLMFASISKLLIGVDRKAPSAVLMALLRRDCIGFKCVLGQLP